MYKIQLDYIVVIFNWMVRRGVKVSAPLVFVEGKGYNVWRFGRRFLKRVL